MSRSKRAALLLVLGGAALALVAGTRTWVSGTVGNQLFDVGGSTAAPGVSALALVSAAGAVVLATAAQGVRRVGAVLVVLAGLGGATLAGAVLRDPVGAVRPAAEAATGTVGSTAAVTASVQVWPFLALLAGFVVAGGGLVALLRGGTWSGPSPRYERPAEDPGRAGASTAWDALSRGDDPTV